MNQPINQNPFAGMQVKASGTEPLPLAMYNTIFQGVEVITNNKFDGPRLQWKFEIASGPHKSKLATALTDITITNNTHTGRLIIGLIGRELVPGEDVNLFWETMKSKIGKAFSVNYARGLKGGKPAVQNISLPPE